MKIYENDSMVFNFLFGVYLFFVYGMNGVVEGGRVFRLIGVAERTVRNFLSRYELTIERGTS